MFTIAAFGTPRGEKLIAAFGFVTCECGKTFNFDFRAGENTVRDEQVQNLICPHCGLTGNKVVVPPYTDAAGTVHGERNFYIIHGE